MNSNVVVRIRTHAAGWGVVRIEKATRLDQIEAAAHLMDAVDEPSQGRGIGTALVNGLDSLARSLGCYGMWVLTDFENPAALATYLAAGGEQPTTHAMITWTYGSGDPTVPLSSR